MPPVVRARHYVCEGCGETKDKTGPGRMPRKCPDCRVQDGERVYTCIDCQPGRQHFTKKRTGRLPTRCPSHRGVPNSALLWEGPSELNGEQIMVVATGIRNGTKNPKIGNMVQIWIVPVVEPKVAFKTGADASVCGDCPHRWSTGGACYVHWRWGPQQVWYTHVKKRGYRQAEPDWLASKRIRFGAYGDPAAVPLQVWRPLLENARGWTGYTHQWRKLDVAAWGWLMASVDNPDQYREAKACGWRTFRVREWLGEVFDREIVCPAASESTAVRKVDCAGCGLCNGRGLDGRLTGVKDIVIEVHGSRVRRFDVDQEAPA